MNIKQTQILHIGFWVIVFTDIAGIAVSIDALHYFAKPLLLPALMLLLFSAVKKAPGKILMLTALFFSWLGDLFLLFENKNPLFFIFGLASFLTTHILYIIYFLNIRNSSVSLLKKHPGLIVVVIVYGISLVWLLFVKLGDLKIPVILYAAVICTMLLCGIHIMHKIKKKAAVLFVCGALLFVLSDSVLALNKFYQPFTFAGVLIMVTYCTAQYCIVKGFINNTNNDKS